MELINLLLAAFGGAGVALLAAAWLTKRWVTHQLDKALEDYKTSLVQKTETLKTELSIYAHEQNVGLSRIDAQRAEAIETIWKTYCDWHEHVITVMAPNRPRGDALIVLEHYRHHSVEMMKQAEKLSMQARDFAIYFDQATFETITACGKALGDTTADYYAASFERANYRTVEEAAIHLPVVDRARESLRERADDAHRCASRSVTQRDAAFDEGREKLRALGRAQREKTGQARIYCEQAHHRVARQRILAGRPTVSRPCKPWSELTRVLRGIKWPSSIYCYDRLNNLNRS